MRAQRLVIALTVANLVLLIVLAQGGSAAPDAKQSVLRAEQIELVDAGGLVRASLKAESGGAPVRANGRF